MDILHSLLRARELLLLRCLAVCQERQRISHHNQNPSVNLLRRERVVSSSVFTLWEQLPHRSINQHPPTSSIQAHYLNFFFSPLNNETNFFHSVDTRILISITAFDI